MVFDFNPIFRDVNVFMRTREAWDLVDGSIFSVRHMTLDEIRQSVISDILAVTMYEIQTGEKIIFDKNRLFRFINNIALADIRNFISAMLPEVGETKDLIIHDSENGYRIRNDVAILQAAMDYCGVYYRHEGIVFPEDLLVVADNEKLSELIGDVEEQLLNCDSEEKVLETINFIIETNAEQMNNIKPKTIH